MLNRLRQGIIYVFGKYDVEKDETVKKILSEDERELLELNERAGKIYGIVNPYKNRNTPIMY